MNSRLLGGIVLVLAVLLAGGGAPAWWVAAGLAAMGLVLLQADLKNVAAHVAVALDRPRSIGIGRFRTQATLRPIVAELVCLGVIVAVTTVMLGDALTTRPVSGDHTVHYAKFLETQALIADTGRPFGWSHELYAGHPLGYQYPWFPDLWVMATRTVLGLDPATGYGVSIWLFWVVLGTSVYAFGRRAHSRAVGLVAAIGYLTTSGEHFMGGWEYVMRWGVWPQWLALAFGLFALSRVDVALGTGRRRTLAATALFVGLALLGHMVMVAGFALALMALLFAWWWGPRPGSASGRLAFARGAVIVLVGVLVAASFLLPFWSTRALTDERANFWSTGYELGHRLLTRGELFGELPLIGLAAVVGGVLALVRRPSFLMVFAVFMVVVALVVSQSSFVGELHLFDVVDPIKNIIWYRIVELGKPFWFLLAAYAVSVGWRHVLAFRLGPHLASSASLIRRALWALAFGFALAPFVGGAFVSWWRDDVARDRHIIFDPPLATERAQLVAWARANLPRDGFYRIANLNSSLDRALSDLGPELGRPLYKPYYTPVSNYLYKVVSASASALEAIDVAYAIADRPLAPMDFEPLAKFGDLRIFRFKHFDAKPFRVVAGHGDVSLVEFTRERIRFHVAPGAEGKLRLDVSYFPRWHATRDGVDVPIEVLPLPEMPFTGFMAVPLLPGDYVLSFEPSGLDLTSLALTPLGLLLCALLALAGPRNRFTRGLERVPAPFLRVAARVPHMPPRVGQGLAVVALGGLVLGVLLLGESIPKRPLPDDTDRKVSAVRWDADHALADADVQLGTERCDWVLDRWLCKGGDPTYQVARVPGMFGQFHLASCLTAEAARGRPLSLGWRGVPAGDALSLVVGGRYANEPQPPRDTTWRVLISGREVDRIVLRSRPAMERRLVDLSKLGLARGTPLDLTLVGEVEDDDGRAGCVSAQMVDLAP